MCIHTYIHTTKQTCLGVEVVDIAGGGGSVVSLKGSLAVDLAEEASDVLLHGS